MTDAPEPITTAEAETLLQAWGTKRRIEIEEEVGMPAESPSCRGFRSPPAWADEAARSEISAIDELLRIRVKASQRAALEERRRVLVAHLDVAGARLRPGDMTRIRDVMVLLHQRQPRLYRVMLEHYRDGRAISDETGVRGRAEVVRIWNAHAVPAARAAGG